MEYLGASGMLNESKSDLCTVVCLTYNQEKFCEAALQSIFDQLYRKLEIVIVDDGSTDDNLGKINRMLEDSPFPFQVIAQKNTGNVGLNFNRAIAAARGTYICFLSMDDLLHPDCISSKIDVMRKDETIMLVTNTMTTIIDNNGVVTDPASHGPLHGRDIVTIDEFIEAEFESIGSFYLQGTVFRRQVISDVGGFDADMTGDDLVLRTKVLLHMARYPDLSFALIEAPGVLYRLHDKNLHKNKKRQIITILEWHQRFFHSRHLSPRSMQWISSYLDQLAREKRVNELREALAENHMHPRHTPTGMPRNG
jgi:alpha-1,3-rhamnosyltransferase